MTNICVLCDKPAPTDYSQNASSTIDCPECGGRFEVTTEVKNMSQLLATFRSNREVVRREIRKRSENKQSHLFINTESIYVQGKVGS